MNTIKRRIERLERSDTGVSGIAERMEAAFRRIEEDPEGSNKRTRQSIAEVDAAVRDGHYVSPLQLRLTEALRHILREEEGSAT